MELRKDSCTLSGSYTKKRRNDRAVPGQSELPDLLPGYAVRARVLWPQDVVAARCRAGGNPCGGELAPPSRDHAPIAASETRAMTQVSVETNACLGPAPGPLHRTPCRGHLRNGRLRPLPPGPGGKWAAHRPARRDTRLARR